MLVNSLSQSKIKSRLNSREGLGLEIGPFTVSIRSSVAHVVDGILNLYGHYPLISDDEFIDYRVRVYSPLNLHRLLGRPQVLFALDNLVPFKPLPLDQAFPMLEWGLNWCVSSNAQEYLIIHSAVVAKNGRCVMLPGAPGAGKSTLCSGLATRGWQLLSDELALISCETGKIAPFPRPISLKNQSIPIMKDFAPGVFFNRESVNTAKGTVAHMKVSEQSIEMAAESVEPFMIVLPKYTPESESVFEPLSKATAFMQVADNAFNYSLLGDAGFNVTGDLVDRCDTYTLAYSDLDDVITIFDEMIQVGR